MSTYQCKACGAVYLNPQRDGCSYFHACAPVHNDAYDEQFATDDKGEPIPTGPLDPLLPATLERPNRRDENVEIKPDGKVAPKADGEGKDVVK